MILTSQVMQRMAIPQKILVTLLFSNQQNGSAHPGFRLRAADRAGGYSSTDPAKVTGGFEVFVRWWSLSPPGWKGTGCWLAGNYSTISVYRGCFLFWRSFAGNCADRLPSAPAVCGGLARLRCAWGAACSSPVTLSMVRVGLGVKSFTPCSRFAFKEVLHGDISSIFLLFTLT